MFKKYQFFSGLALLLITCNLYAATASNASNDCKTTTSLYPNQWQIIGIPCEAPENANTVKAIFADDIPVTMVPTGSSLAITLPAITMKM